MFPNFRFNNHQNNSTGSTIQPQYELKVQKRLSIRDSSVLMDNQELTEVTSNGGLSQEVVLRDEIEPNLPQDLIFKVLTFCFQI